MAVDSVPSNRERFPGREPRIARVLSLPKRGTACSSMVELLFMVQKVAGSNPAMLTQKGKARPRLDIKRDR